MEALPGDPAVYFSIDANRCARADAHAPLEGRSVQPDIVVEYDPQDLANGVDTVMERAAEELLGM